ncbi:hypothetical protein HPULCUR_005759 [Helicostylum pulchrum]|uniref:Uncharacterized protein n=1 Tax=Helicostylum pulchrum TaxID=562976 RepID=A0ABP9Y1Y8_9FUNG
MIKDMYSSSIDFHPSLLAWLNAILECNRHQLNCFITTTSKKSARVWSFYSTHIIKGAAVTAFEAIQNSDIHAKPCIVSENTSRSHSSVFLNAKPNVVFNIDISFKSTLLSYSLLNEDGAVEKVFDNEYFEVDSLPPLESFYKVSDVTTLNVVEQYISLMETYSNDDLNCPSFAGKTETQMHGFKSILNKSSFGNESLVSTRQRKYIKQFMLMYLLYIKQIISSKLSTGLNFIATMDTKIGYIISIEKMLLDRIIGTKAEFKRLVLTSGLFPEDDNLKKLKIITQGEGLLPVIQNFWKLEFPIKTYFVLAQLHENYIQLTLNQVVTTSSSKQEESIALKDKIVPIQNIYDSLCMHVWIYIMEHSQSIQLCDIHVASSEFIQLFSLNTKTQFLSNLRQFISENLLTKKSELETDKQNMIQLNDDCGCRVCLTVTDIVDIAFKPILQTIASFMSASLINTNYFGSYKGIQYLFGLIYFNYNPQFQIILANILKSELDNFNEGQEIEAFCEIIPKLPKQILMHTIGQKPFMYKYFQFGRLHQISSANYGFIIAQYADSDASESEKPLYKDKKSDKDVIVCEDIALMELFH